MPAGHFRTIFISGIHHASPLCVAPVQLARKYPDVRFLGTLVGEELAKTYCLGDVLVFPSLADTFGNVLSKRRITAFRSQPSRYQSRLAKSVISGQAFWMKICRASMAALGISRFEALAHAAKYTWEECGRIFMEAGLNAACQKKALCKVNWRDLNFGRLARRSRMSD
ncbi:MAG: hypothetical protein R3D32_10200 [Nitratireductor sp.]